MTTTVAFTVILDDEEGRYKLYKDIAGYYSLRAGANVVMFDNPDVAIQVLETAVKRIREYEKAIKDTPSIG